MEIQKLVKEAIRIGKQNKDSVHIALCADKNVIRSLGVTMYSILKHSHKSSMFHIFYNGILEQEEVKRFEQLIDNCNAACNIYSMNNTFFSTLHHNERISVTAYYRLMVPYILSDYDVSRVLYLDTDILCIQNISNLFSVDLKNKLAYVVRNSKYMQDSQVKYRISIGINPNEYFNSGVLLLNIRPYIEQDIGNKALQLATSNSFIEMDQDILNILLKGKVIFDSEYFYNFTMQVHDDEWKPDWKDKIKLIHFTSDKKPWKLYTSNWGENKKAIQDTVHSWKYPYFKLWRQYASESPWKDVPLDMPKNYKEWRYLSTMHWQNGEFVKAVNAYYQYMLSKFNEKNTGAF